MSRNPGSLLNDSSRIPGPSGLLRFRFLWHRCRKLSFANAAHRSPLYGWRLNIVKRFVNVVT